jgi:hypothetical protein
MKSRIGAFSPIRLLNFKVNQFIQSSFFVYIKAFEISLLTECDAR